MSAMFMKKVKFLSQKGAVTKDVDLIEMKTELRESRAEFHRTAPENGGGIVGRAAGFRGGVCCPRSWSEGSRAAPSGVAF